MTRRDIDPDDPQCPKGCDVATPPERYQGGFICVACGSWFPWPPVITKK